jgi:hypothetical protein
VLYDTAKSHSGTGLIKSFLLKYGKKVSKTTTPQCVRRCSYLAFAVIISTSLPFRIPLDTRTPPEGKMFLRHVSSAAKSNGAPLQSVVCQIQKKKIASVSISQQMEQNERLMEQAM